MQSAFQRAVNFKKQDGDTVFVWINGLGVLDSASTDRYLLTFHVATCSGLALVSDDKTTCALTHLFSDTSMCRYSEEELKIHAAKFWEQIEGRLPVDMKFRAVACGGYRADNGQDASVTQKEIDEFRNHNKLLGDFFYITGNNFEYYIGNPERQEERRYKNVIENYKRLFDLEQMLSYHTEKFSSVRSRISTSISSLLGDALFNAAMNSGRISEMEDVRFRDAPHDVVVDRTEGEIYVSKNDSESLWNRMGPGERTRGERIIRDHYILS